jgi:hypothetical protein
MSLFNWRNTKTPRPAGFAPPVHHILLEAGVTALPPLQGGMYDYLICREAVYIHARRDGLEVLMPHAILDDDIRGLAELPVKPFVRLSGGRVPQIHLDQAYREATEAKGPHGRPIERLWHLGPARLGWYCHAPLQQATGGSVTMVDTGPEANDKFKAALIELHSHHGMPSFFSPTDDQDEVGFRLYAVIGDIFEAPKISVRVGVYGQFWHIPADWVFELPKYFKDNHNLMEVHFGINY